MRLVWKGLWTGGRVIIQRFSILKKGMILIAIPLLFQLGFIALVAGMRHAAADAESWTIHTKEVIALVEQCRSRLLAAHGAIQGYVFTGDAGFRDQLGRLAGQARERLAELKGQVSDNDSQTRKAIQIEALAVRFIAFMTEGAAITAEGRMTPDLARSRRRAGGRLLDELDRDFEAFIAAERGQYVDRQAKLAATGRLLDRSLTGGILLSLLTSVALARLFARNIGDRIAGLTENAYRLADGQELKPRIEGGDEIARLDRVFHDMASTLAVATEAEREHAETVRLRAEELAEVVGQLREKAQENDMFVYSVSHDLRSPLVNLQGFSKELGLIGGDLKRLVDAEGVPDGVRQKARGMLDAEMAESIGFIQSAVTRLSAIIDALLRLSRAGRVEYRRQEVEVGPIVARVVAALRGTICSKKVAVEVEYLPPAFADATAVEQVFANLIGNALNYLDPDRPGRVVVKAVSLDPATAPPLAVELGMVVFAVEDNGLGIPDRYRDKIFTAFQRLHGDIAKGEGIGLALVRRVVERHEGRIWFLSEAGRGTTFFVALPARGPEPRPAEAERELLEVASGSEGPAWRMDR